MFFLLNLKSHLISILYFGVCNKMASFQGSRSALHRGKNPVIVEQPKKQNKIEIENPVNPIPVHGENYYIPINWTLRTQNRQEMRFVLYIRLLMTEGGIVFTVKLY